MRSSRSSVVGRVEGVLADLDPDQLAGAADGHAHQAVAHRAVDGGLRELLLRGHHLLLHLLGLLEQGVHVEPALAEGVLAVGHGVSPGSVMLDLLDDARTELTFEKLRTAEALVIGVGVVAMGVVVGRCRA